jgi:hypothetical protein
LKTLILSCHSAANEPLARLTAANKWAYSARHGYDLLTIRLDWADHKRLFLERVREQLDRYDVVLTIGSDVLFMNHAIRIEDRMVELDDIVMARERLGDLDKGWASINADVMIWRATPRSFHVLDVLIDNTPVWSSWPQLWQRYLEKLLLEQPPISSFVRLVAPREMNATPYPGALGINQWQPGDWIFHAVCGDLAGKMEAIQAYLPRVESD